MAQVNLYLDEDTARKLKTVAKASGLSQSKWVAKLIRERVSDEWPRQLAALAGAWPDIPDAEDLRQGLGQDSLREPL
ncbi:MAG: CopG family transcriptional regulator [Gammaproteobacteria bacterium]